MLTATDFVSYLISMSISSVISLVAYLLTAFGIFEMGKKLGVSKPWLAFIPFANVYAFGKIAEHYIKHDGRPSAKFSKILLIIEIITVVLAFALIVGVLVGVVLEAMSNPDLNAYFESQEFASTGLYTFVLPIVLSTLLIVALALVNLVVTYVALWRIYAIFDPDSAMLYLILSIFISILQPIFIFILRHREPQIFMPQQIVTEQTENIM